MCRYSFFFKQKTAYEMRISDWSSDVCSSDLFAADAFFLQLIRGLGAFVHLPAVRHQRDVRAFAADLGDAQRNPVVLERHVALDATQQLDRFQMDHWRVIENGAEQQSLGEIGRAPCRGEVWQYV